MQCMTAHITTHYVAITITGNGRLQTLLVQVFFTTHMQFLAAKSLWTNLHLARYSIPWAMSKHTPISIGTLTPCKNEPMVYKQWEVDNVSIGLANKPTHHEHTHNTYIQQLITAISTLKMNRCKFPLFVGYLNWQCLLRQFEGPKSANQPAP